MRTRRRTRRRLKGGGPRAFGESCTKEGNGPEPCSEGLLCEESLCTPGPEARHLHSLLQDPTSKAEASSIEYLRAHPFLINQALDKSGNTPLHVALHMNASEPLVRFLLEQGADPTRTTLDAQTPLHKGVTAYRSRTLPLLLAHESKDRFIDAQDKDGDTALLKASFGALPAAQLLLAAGANPDRVNRSGASALTKAVLTKHVDLIEELLRSGANVNLPNGEGKTPLILALEEHVDETIAIRLLDAGADPTGALLVALTYSRPSTSQRLVAASRTDPRIDLHAKDAHGRSVLQALLSATFYLPTLQADLLGHLKHLLNEQDPVTGLTPLMESVLSDKQNQSFLACDQLLRAGADPNLKNKDGDTALLLAIKAHRPSLVKRLVAAGARADEPDAHGVTTIEYARRRYPHFRMEVPPSGPSWKSLYTNARSRKNTLIGKGVFGATRKLTRNNGPVAVKRIRWGYEMDPNGVSASHVDDVNGELDALGRLGDNPYVVRLHDYEPHESNGYIVMELLQDGTDLFQAVFEDARLTDADLKPLVLHLLQGLESIHVQGILHLDIKPDNIWLYNDNRIKYLDFGLAHANPYRGRPRGALGYRKVFHDGLENNYREPRYGNNGNNGNNAPPPNHTGSFQDKRSDFYSLAQVLGVFIEHLGLSADTVAWLTGIKMRLLDLRDDQNATEALPSA